jgi:hypothetical protein
VNVETLPFNTLVHNNTDGPTEPLNVEFDNTVTLYCTDAFAPAHTSVTECGPPYNGEKRQYDTHDDPLDDTYDDVVTFNTLTDTHPASLAHDETFDDRVAYTWYKLIGDAMHPPTPVNDAYDNV